MTMHATGEPALRELAADEFVAKMRKAVRPERDMRYALFLGAGCSVTSGIPSASELVVNHWLPRWRAERDDDGGLSLFEWARKQIPGFDPADPGASYGEVIDKMFPDDDEKQAETEDFCDAGFPSFAYATLAQLMATHRHFCVALTTNFDDLLSHSLSLYANSRPVVVAHSALARFAESRRDRPLIVKLHGDASLAPKHTAADTRTVHADFKAAVGSLLQNRGLIFMGYRGADQGVLRLLEDLDANALRQGVFWVHRDEPEGRLREWLASRRGTWVKCSTFDELMLRVRHEFGLAHPTREQSMRRHTEYLESFTNLTSEVACAGIVNEEEDRLPLYWRFIGKARRLLRAFSPERAPIDPVLRANIDGLYRQAFQSFKHSAAMRVEYARFLKGVGRLAQAAKQYGVAIRLDPTRPATLASFARFCDKHVRLGRVRATEYHRKAVELEPDNAYFAGNFAFFLQSDPACVAEAAIWYERALRSDPRNRQNLLNRARFLHKILQDIPTAVDAYEDLFRQYPRDAEVLEFYSSFLHSIGRDQRGAMIDRWRREAGYAKTVATSSAD